MGIKLSEVGVKIWKFMIISGRACFKSVCDHPFFVGFVFFLILLYRSFPFLFALLVSASPVLVCTAVLLGTLLSFGQPNIPEIEKEEKRNHEISSLKTGVGVSTECVVVESDGSFAVENFSGKKGDLVEKSIHEASSTTMVSELERDGNSHIDSMSLVEENSREIQFEKRVIGESDEGLLELGSVWDSEMNNGKSGGAEGVEDQHNLMQEVGNENGEMELNRSSMEYVNYCRVDNPNPSPVFSWKQVEEEGEEEEEASDSGSDRAESSSPDASMADIIPMLDELHPLLDEDAPHPDHKSHVGSYAASLQSQKSDVGIHDLDEDTENQLEEEVGDDDDDDDDEEEMQDSKDKETKSAITWTEDDQKNLIDLGTSELERNLRLENLIARRRARKDLRLMAEKNLIDLESSDIPFNIAPISTARRNPFDLPYDANDNMGLPPIPGSAPSILLPRRNPFDLPYDSGEEKPDLTGDSSPQEFVPFQPKETLFRRHESFNVGPSIFGPLKPEKQDIKLRPYFVPERISERTSFAYFQRQSSELSESQVSSVPETESVSSAGDQEDKKLNEEDFSQDVEQISSIEHAYELVKHGSESSQDIDSMELGQAEKKDVELNEIKLGGLENHHEMESSLSTTGIGIPVEDNTGEVHQKIGAVDSSKSSTSSSAELNEKIFAGKEDKGLSSLELRKGNLIKESGIAVQPSLEEPGYNVTSALVDDNQPKEPVYDTSPTSVEKSELILATVLVERHISFVDGDSSECDQSKEKNAPATINAQMFTGSSWLHEEDEKNMGSREVTETSEHGVLKSEFSQVVESANTSIVLKPAVENASVSSEPSSDIKSDHLMYQDGSHQSELEQIPSSSFGANVHVSTSQDVSEKVDSVASSSQDKFSGDLNLAAPTEEQPSLIVEQVSSTHLGTASDTKLTGEHSVNKEVGLQIVQDESSSSDANFHVSLHHEADEKLVSTHYQCIPEENSLSELDKQMPFMDKSTIQSSFDNHEEHQEPRIIQVESVHEVSATRSLNLSEVQESSCQVSPKIYSTLTPDPAFFPSEVSEMQSSSGLEDLKDKVLDKIENEEQIRVSDCFNYPAEAIESFDHERNVIEEADEIKEIDEGLLLELDTVGDFSVKELGASHTMHILAGQSEIPDLDHIKAEINYGMPVLEAQSLEDIDAAFKRISGEELKKSVVIESNYVELMPEEIEPGSSNYEVLHKDSSLTETNLELPVIEARSVEDINLTFKLLHEGLDAERSLLHSSVDDREDVAKCKDPADISSDFHITESNALEDCNIALKQVSEDNLEKMLKSDTEEGSTKIEANEVDSSKETESTTENFGISDTSTSVAEKSGHGADAGGISETAHQDQLEVETNSGMPVLEAQSLEDIDSAFKKIVVEEMKKPVVSESSHAELTAEETKSGYSNYESSNLKGSNLELQIIEARSVEDIDLAFKQLHEEMDVERSVLPSSVDWPDASESNYSAEANSSFHTIKTSSVEDTIIAPRQCSEGDLEKVLKSDSEYGSVKAEANEASSSKEMNQE